MDLKKELQKLSYYNTLSQDQKEYLYANTIFRKYDRGNIINNGKDVCLGMIYLLKGTIRVYILSEEGREITLFSLQAGDACVLSASCVLSQIDFDTQMVIEKDCELLITNSGALGRLMQENIYVKCFLYEIAVERFSTVMTVMQDILFKGYDRRLAGFLVKEYKRTDSLQIKMTHEQIAQQTSSAREVVARMLKRFSAEGLVETKRGLIQIKEIRQLEEMC